MNRIVTVTLLLVAMLAVFTAPAHAQRVITNPSTYDAYGYTVTNSVTTTSSAAAVNIVTTKAMLYGLAVNTGTNSAVTAVWINVFNAATANVTPGTTAAFMSFELSSKVSQGSEQQYPIPFGSPLGVPFSTAISINCTTTRNGATAASSPCGFVSIHKP